MENKENKKKLDAQWYKDNKDSQVKKMKKYYQDNKEKIKKNNRDNFKLDKKIYYVYYLPEENYCGTSLRPEHRIHKHKSDGRNVEGLRVLFSSEDKDEAYHVEAQFQSVLGMNGLIYNKNKDVE